MQLVSPNQSEVRLTLEAAIEMVNAIADGETDLRPILEAHGFSRAERASSASMVRLRDRIDSLRALVSDLPDLDTEAASRRVNEELTEVPLAPSIVDHGGVGPHLHWTASTARFDDQVMADVLMAIAQELCDNGTERFGRCGAEDCESLFYDGTRNRSRRFCNDPRCASRTHTADHRARRKKR